MIHRAGDEAHGLILNAAAYTHTSVAVRDAVAAIDIPVVELHLSNPDAREAFRRQNLLADVVVAGIRGFGVEGYRLALEGMAALLRRISSWTVLIIALPRQGRVLSMSRFTADQSSNADRESEAGLGRYK